MLAYCESNFFFVFAYSFADAQALSDEENDDSVAEEQEHSSAAGVQFFMESNCWRPLPHCSQHALPREFPKEGEPFALRRQTCSDVVHVEHGGTLIPFLSEQGFMIGPDCAPERSPTALCHNCHRSWLLAPRHHCGDFVLRTYMGAVCRAVYMYVCDCNATLNWNPSTEFIHTIGNGLEGGACLNTVSVTLDSVLAFKCVALRV